MSDAQNWSELGRPTPEWFRKAPLGIFIHWGPYSVPAWAEPSGELGTLDPAEWHMHNAYAEWYYNTIRIDGSPAQKHHQEAHDGADYDAFLDQWTAEKFDAGEWMKLIVESGADYVIPTTKHHDGIALWDAPETGERNTVHRGPRRDLIGEIASSAKEHGLRLGLYYSGGLDWHVRPFPPHMSHESVHDTDRPKDAEFARYVYTHVKDLIERFTPDVLWNDIDWPDEGKHFGEYGLGDLFNYFYREHPEGVVNDRWGQGTHSDYSTSEYKKSDESKFTGAWEFCRGIGLSFGYNQMEGAEHHLDGPGISRKIGDVVSRGGRVLLNIGPRADGTIPELQRDALLDTGRWMRVAKPVLVEASPTDYTIQTDVDGWARVLNSGSSTILLVDRPDGTAGRVEVTGFDHVDLDTISSVTPEWGRSIAQDNGAVTVELAEGRPGPTILRL